MTMPIETPYLTVNEAAAYLAITPNALRCHLRRGHIPMRRLGRKILIHRDSLDATLVMAARPARASRRSTAIAA